MPRRTAAAAAIAAAFFLHQDQWFWTESRPLLFGVLPPGLWYHVLYALGCAGLMWWLARMVWPSHLEE